MKPHYYFFYYQFLFKNRPKSAQKKFEGHPDPVTEVVPATPSPKPLKRPQALKDAC